MILALVRHAAEGGTPVWATVLAAVGGGTVGTGVGAWQARKLIPSQRREIETSAARAAVETVNDALTVARGQITTLRTQVTDLSERVGALRTELGQSKDRSQRIEQTLNLALSERAVLQQQIVDLTRIVGDRRISALARVRPPDAILMVSLETGEIGYASEGIYGLLGYVPSAVVGAGIDTLVPEAERIEHAQLRKQFQANPAHREMGTGLPLFARTVEGETIPVDINLNPTGDGRVLVLIKRRDQPPADEPQEIK